MEKIAKLKFLIHFYILSSFFNDIKTSTKIDLASNLSTYVPSAEEKITLNTIDLSNILNFIKLLSDFDIMPGLNKYLFSSKFVRFFGSNFLPALEDPGRFYASIYISSLRGQNIVPGFIKKYNQREYANMIHFTHTTLL
ncbi:MAG: hypothetical protein KatS3mg002_0461 [Candidatus Woesearchaeota archaeon]|nr:MAG: hypothetical protein KatS3mg002_0461 [Candidatus Woesearchaeota archaeon]